MSAAAKRQPEIPGTERKTIPELEEVALAFERARYERMRLQQEESRLGQQMLDRMEAVKDQLESDGSGPLYVVIDGEYKVTFRLKASRKVSMERSKVEQ